MKKRAYLLAIIMGLALLAACGSKKTDGPKEDKKETEAAKETDQIDYKEKFKDRENFECSLFKVYYPSDWKYNEEALSTEEGYSYVYFFDGEESDNSSHSIEVRAEDQDGYSFHKDLESRDIDLESYANGDMDIMEIGNADYTKLPEDGYGQTAYKYRHEPSGITYTVEIEKGELDDSVKELLEGVILELEDKGLEDSPWPWEGTAFEPEPAEQMVGSYTIVPEYIPFEEPQGVMQIMKHQFAKEGDQIFHSLEDKLDTYQYSEDGLSYVSSMELDRDYEYISIDKSGMLYLSPGINQVIGMKDGKQAFQTTVKGFLNMHSSGEWGISFWVNSDTQKVKSQDGNFVAEPWILTGLNKDDERQGPFRMVDDLQITDSHIMVAGPIAAEDGNNKIIIYDYDGNQLLELGGTESSDPDKIGYITGMAETENGFVAIDGNMRKIHFWAKDGTHIGTISTSDLLGCRYPWLEDMQLLDDGSLWILLTQRREDDSANELMFFRLTGF